jgi:hypothetical protein
MRRNRRSTTANGPIADPRGRKMVAVAHDLGAQKRQREPVESQEFLTVSLPSAR